MIIRQLSRVIFFDLGTYISCVTHLPILTSWYLSVICQVGTYPKYEKQFFSIGQSKVGCYLRLWLSVEIWTGRLPVQIIIHIRKTLLITYNLLRD